MSHLHRWISRRLWKRAVEEARRVFEEESCPNGGLHDWDLAWHGPDGSAFDCMKCGKRVT